MSTGPRWRWRHTALVLVTLIGTADAAQAQRGGRSRTPDFQPNVPYDGRYTFVRVKYDIPQNFNSFRGVDVKWSHDYPRGERHFTKIISELSATRVRTDASNILALDDPELCKYPVAYMAEPGFWHPSPKEVDGLQKYLAKGGFIIFDDFAAEHWMNFEEQMRKVLPKAKAILLTPDHRIFDAFYRVKSLEYVHPYYGMKSEFYGYYEDNDPGKRMIAMVNYNNDMSEYWEFSDEGMFPVGGTNEAYKLGVNYIIYALTR